MRRANAVRRSIGVAFFGASGTSTGSVLFVKVPCRVARRSRQRPTPWLLAALLAVAAPAALIYGRPAAVQGVLVAAAEPRCSRAPVRPGGGWRHRRLAERRSARARRRKLPARAGAGTGQHRPRRARHGRPHRRRVRPRRPRRHPRADPGAGTLRVLARGDIVRGQPEVVTGV